MQGILRHIVSIPQRMIGCRQVTEGTDTYENNGGSVAVSLKMIRRCTLDNHVMLVDAVDMFFIT